MYKFLWWLTFGFFNLGLFMGTIYMLEDNATMTAFWMGMSIVHLNLFHRCEDKVEQKD